MSHPDEETLAGLALGEGTAGDREHVDSCDACRAEVDAYAAAALRVSHVSDRGPLLSPPASVWEAINAEVAPAHAVADAPEPEPAPASADVPDDLAPRRRRMPVWAVAVAAAGGVVLGAGAVLGVLTLGGGDGDVSVVAQAPLSDLATESDAGSAVLETRDDGTQVLVVDTEFTVLDDAYLEVWLIDESIEGMVSLGHLTGERTEFVLPAGFDASAFPIVDISVEPLDGVPTHSGDSVTRGVLEA